MADKKMRTFSQFDHANNDDFNALSNNASSLYARIINNFWFQIQCDDRSSQGWIIGKIETSKAEIIRGCKYSEWSFYHGTWKELIEAGFVREEKGLIILPRFKSKGVSEESENGSTIPEEVVNEPDRLNKIEQTLEQLAKAVSLMSEALIKKSPEVLPETPPVERKGPEMTPTGLARYFLELAGHKETPKALNDAEAGISEMLVDYSYEEIGFGIKYIFENSPEKPKTIKYIMNGMSRAMGAYEKENARKKKENEKYDQVHLERQRYDEMAEKLDAYIADLEPEKYHEYVELVIKELKEKGINQEFITDIAISAGVRRVIRCEIFGDDEDENQLDRD